VGNLTALDRQPSNYDKFRASSRKTALPRRTASVLLLCLITLLPIAFSQEPLQTDAVGPQRFIAAHGRKAIAMGYASSGLELWAYPLQIIGGYELGFRPSGGTTEINGPSLLRRVTYEPQAILRTYIGPDFIVREKLFVPLNDAAIFLTYSVESRHSVDLVVHFTPVLDLMWPASVGGQSAQWSTAASAYLLTDGTHKYSALIGSPDVTSHDEVMNTAQPGSLGNRLAFAIRLGGDAHSSATVVVARTDQVSPADRMKQLLSGARNLETEAKEHYASLSADALRIRTPDPAVNQQLAWAQIALDQAWVCNPVLGCGLVAGYGPSRNARRPQYDWFFAGDGLFAIQALLNTGEYDRAREALDFIAKYQDARTGMIWHELSQSADPADWATKYPYMFVHVDITFQYLATLGSYVAASGDTQFLQQHWSGIEAAYRYCQTLLNLQDGLPRIPSTKLGGDEQDKITEDLDLSVSWVAASAAFADLGRLSGHPLLAEEATRASDKARDTVVRHYWDDQQHAWIDGYNESGHAIVRRGDGGVVLLGKRILDQTRSDTVLDQLASSAFQTDWGTRGVAAGSAQFDPSSYAKGSVSALGTAGVATAFWSQHRPYTAFPIWSALLPWGTLDSMGHMHEVLAGDFYHPQAESVPEQTWSSAAFLSSAVQGLLGLTREAQTNRLAFAPHLPTAWNTVSVENIKVAGGKVTLTVARVPEGLDLNAENSGRSVELHYSPEIPIGAHLGGADLNGKPLTAHIEDHPQDTHATVTFPLPAGKSHCLIRYQGGFSVNVKNPVPLQGDASRGVRITSVTYKEGRLAVQFDVSGEGIVELQTSERPLKTSGAQLTRIADDLYDLTVPFIDGAEKVTHLPDGYRHTEVIIDFANH
jgi:glycogen debranching enzyme